MFSDIIFAKAFGGGTSSIGDFLLLVIAVYIIKNRMPI